MPVAASDTPRPLPCAFRPSANSGSMETATRCGRRRPCRGSRLERPRHFLRSPPRSPRHPAAGPGVVLQVRLNWPWPRRACAAAARAPGARCCRCSWSDPALVGQRHPDACPVERLIGSCAYSATGVRPPATTRLAPRPARRPAGRARRRFPRQRLDQRLGVRKSALAVASGFTVPGVAVALQSGARRPPGPQLPAA